MDAVPAFYKEAISLLHAFDLIEIVVVSINVLLMLFARRIMKVIYHDKDDSTKLGLRVNLFRLLNFLIIIAFTYYHMYMPVSSRSIGFKIVVVLVILYLSYGSIYVANYMIRQRLGGRREIEGHLQYIETYHSRLYAIFISVFIFIIALISIVQILGFDSLLEAGGVIGFIGVFLALTQSAWAPDMFSGLIILNSRMVEVGDVIEFNDGDNSLGVVYKTKVFHTELLNLINNHRIMIKNSKLRDYTIHNLSKFASAKGLRKRISFNIDYAVEEQKVRELFKAVCDTIAKQPEIAIEPHPLEIGVTNTGDYAVEWCVYYYTKDVKNIMKTRQQFRELTLSLSKQRGISLATPLRHVVEQQ